MSVHRPPPSCTGHRVFTQSRQSLPWTCGSISVQMALEHYGLDVHPVVLQALLLTNPITGTFFASMARLLRAYGLGARLRMSLGYRETKAILGSRGLVLASVDEGTHVGVIYAAKRSHVWFADPSSSMRSSRP